MSSRTTARPQIGCLILFLCAIALTGAFWLGYRAAYTPDTNSPFDKLMEQVARHLAPLEPDYDIEVNSVLVRLRPKSIEWKQDGGIPYFVSGRQDLHNATAAISAQPYSLTATYEPVPDPLTILRKHLALAEADRQAAHDEGSKKFVDIKIERIKQAIKLLDGQDWH